MEKEIKVFTKSLGNTDTNGASKNVSDLVVWGEPDMWKLLSKASSQNEGWMKSTKALEVEGVGCYLQVTTQQGNNVTDSVTWAPGVKIIVTGETKRESDGATIVTSRRLVSMDYKEKEDEEEDAVKKIDSILELMNPYDVCKKLYMMLKMNKNSIVAVNGKLIEISRPGKCAYISSIDEDNSKGILYCNLDWISNSSFESFVEDFGFSAMMLALPEEKMDDVYSTLWEIASEIAGDDLTLSKLDIQTRDYTRFISREMNTPDGKFVFTRHFKEECALVDDNYVIVTCNGMEVYKSGKLYKTTSRFVLSTTDVLNKIIVGYILAFKK